MKLSQRAAYLQGLADGLNLKDAQSLEKVLREAISVLAEVSDKVEDLDGEVGNICEELDTIEDDLYESEDDDDDANEDAETDDSASQYELTCPKCGAVTVVDEDTLMSQEIVCSNCGAPFDIEFGDKEETSEDSDK